MSIATRIQSMYENVGDVYDTITNVTLPSHKNIENIPRTIRDSYLEIMNNGINVVWENWEKVTGTGETLTLNQTEYAPMEFRYGGNTTQETTTGKNKARANPTSFEYPASTNTIKTLGSIDLVAGTTYYYSYTIDNATTSNTRNTPFLQISGGNKQYENTGTNYNLTTGRKTWTYNCQTTGEYTFGFWVNGSNANVTIDQVMISTSNDTTYEPYTGGTASPNPSYPQEVHTVSGDNSIEVEGKNLFQKLSSGSQGTLTLTANDDGSYTLNGTPSSSYNFKLDNKILEAGNYSLQCKYEGSLPNNSNARVQVYSSNNSFTLYVLNNENSTKVIEATLSNNSTDVEFRIRVEGGFNYQNVKMYPYLVKGTYTSETMPSFEPYQNQTYPINLPEGMELCKIGTYQDKIDKSSGKNLWNEEWEQGGINNNTGELETGTGFIRTKEYLEIKPSTTYYRTPTIEATRIFFYTSTQAYISNVSLSAVGGTFTTPSNAKYLLFKEYVPEYNNDIAIYEGNTPQEYEPYGTSWYLKKEIGKIILNGSENWELGSSGDSRFYRINNAITNYVYQSSIPQPLLCSHFTNTSISSSNTDVGFYIAGSGQLRFREANMQTLADWKTWVSNNNLIIYYAQDTPTYTLIEGELLNQLEAIKMSYEGQTNLSQTNNDLPFILTANALEKI